MITKLIIDTNIWLSYLLTNNFSELNLIINSKQYEIIISDLLLEEMNSVFLRPKFSKILNIEKVNRFIDYIIDNSTIINSNLVVEICRDKKDDFLLSLSITANADYLITGDKDLLILNSIANTKIITYRDFINNYFKK